MNTMRWSKAPYYVLLPVMAALLAGCGKKPVAEPPVRAVRTVRASVALWAVIVTTTLRSVWRGGQLASPVVHGALRPVVVGWSAGCPPGAAATGWRRSP